MANKPADDEIDQHIPDAFNLQGARLAKITLALAYRLIINKHDHHYNRSTLTNLDIARHTIADINVTLETDPTMAHLAQNAPSRHPKIHTNFLFKAIHGTLRIGGYWSRTPTYEIRAKCPHCDYSDESHPNRMPEYRSVNKMEPSPTHLTHRTR